MPGDVDAGNFSAVAFGEGENIRFRLELGDWQCGIDKYTVGCRNPVKHALFCQGEKRRNVKIFIPTYSL